MVTCRIGLGRQKAVKSSGSANKHNLEDFTAIQRTSHSQTSLSSPNTAEVELAAADNNNNKTKEVSSAKTAPFLMLGSDVMASVVGFLEPRQTLDLLTVPLCKQWRRSYTSDQDLWRTICCSEPFSANLSGDTSSASSSPSSAKSHDKSNHKNDADDNGSVLSSMNDFESALGEFRLIYTSFVRCMRYLDHIQNNDDLDLRSSNTTNMFPKFGVTKSLKQFLSRSMESDHLLSVIGNGIISISADDRKTIRNPNSKEETKTVEPQKPKYGNSMITNRLWGPTANGVPSYLNLPKSCAIYSIVNWMVAHPNVRGIQTMCIQSLPSLLEDEEQRLVGRRVGLVEVILCAMLRFPDSVDLHTAVFHAIVLLARPLGGREGMLFNSRMAQTTQNIGITSFIELSDSVSLAARCGGHPSLDKEKMKINRNVSKASTAMNTSNDDGTKTSNGTSAPTGLSIMVDSMKRFSSSEKLQSMACWAMVNVALVPLQKYRVMRLGGIDAILSAMEEHPKSFDVQFRALFALINLAVPCRPHDFAVDNRINGVDACREERQVLDKLGPRIARLSVMAMKNFWHEEDILNRGCLVVHNLSQCPQFIPALMEDADCYHTLSWCLENYDTDRVLLRSVSSTLDRMRDYLIRNPNENRRLGMLIPSHHEAIEDLGW